MKKATALYFYDLRQGDLLFMRDSSDISRAITGIEKESVYSHVGIYFDGMIYHATQKKGVNKQLLKAYLAEERKEVSVYRLDFIDAKKTKSEAEKYLGLPYNHGFYPDAKGFYCSQYVAKILPIFETVPMKFNDGLNEISGYWKKYYEKLGLEVPLNQPGTNPYQLSLSKKLAFIGKLQTQDESCDFVPKQNKNDYNSDTKNKISHLIKIEKN